MTAPRHLARTRAEHLAAKLGGPATATAPSWRLTAKVSYKNGGYTNYYRSLVDRRISAALRVDRPDAKARIAYAFTESDKVFCSLIDVAMAVIADDDDLAWQMAAPGARASA